MHPALNRRILKLALIELIALRTKALAPLMIFPFFIIFVMIIARSNLFEGGVWSWPLLSIYMWLGLILIFPLLVLRREAAQTRSEALEELKLLRASESDATEVDAYQRKIDLVIGRVESQDQGAFAPWFRHPIFQALVLPFTGGGGLLLLDYI